MRLKATYHSESLYRNYVKRKGKVRGNVTMTQTLHSAILTDFFDRLFDAMIYNNVDITLPHHLGNLSIKKRKLVIRLNPEGKLDTTRLRVDYKSTKELQKEDPGTTRKVYFLNEHTDGYYYRYLWSKVTCFVPNSTVYLLDIRRKYKRRLKDAIMSGANLEHFVLN